MAYHYHIRWSGNTPLDWDRFSTVEEAESAAAKLVRPGESYSVEKFDDDCVRCAQLKDLSRRHLGGKP